MWSYFQSFIDQSLRRHLNIGLAIRLILVVYSSYHDAHFQVSYTDIDYKVFSDAASHVYEGESPYKRHTYRYSPIIAYLLVPNVMLGSYAGKILFSFFDIFIAIAIQKLVECELGPNKSTAAVSTYCSLFWLYNPMSIAISTRGNADSIPCFFVIMSIYFLRTNVIRSLYKYVLAGTLLGIAIHLRLYPLAFSYPMFYSLGEYKIHRTTSIADGFVSLMPNKRQILLTASCILTLTLLTSVMYKLYGYEFLFETYIYHLFRKDTKHNFSILFYNSYLTMNHFTFDVVNTILLIFRMLLILLVSLTFGTKSQTLPLALFCQPIVLVIYNSVITSQYFIWFLSLLPLVVHSFKMRPARALRLFALWLAAQGGWLFFAYLLEFKNKEVFLLIWLNSVVFFCTNIYILVELIKSYRPGYGFGKFEQLKYERSIYH